MTPAQFRQREVAAAEAKARAADLNRRTLDVVQIGDQASESAHGLAGDNTQTGTHHERRWRHARGWFRYEVKVDANRPTQLLCTWWGSDAGGREFDIVVDGRVVATEQLENSPPGEFFDRTYDLPTDLTRGKSRVEVKFQARPGQTAGGLFGLRVIRAD
jgi:hypothetical protein